MPTTDARVDRYIAARPEDQRPLLQALRERVARVVPEAEETIAYGMPAFRLDGKFLLSYAGWKRHCSVYPVDDALLARHAALVGGYASTKGGLHFGPGQPLPDALVDELARGRVAAVRSGHRDRHRG